MNRFSTILIVILALVLGILIALIYLWTRGEPGLMWQSTINVSVNWRQSYVVVWW